MMNNDISAVLAQDDMILFCSLSGRVLEVSQALSARLKVDLVGVNLNDFIEDRIVSQIIINSTKDSVYEFSCTIRGNLYRCGARISGSDRLIVVLVPIIAEGPEIPPSQRIAILCTQINEVTQNILIAYSMLKNEYEGKNSRAVSLINHSIANLARMSKIMASQSEYEAGSLYMNMKAGDLRKEIKEVVLRAAQVSQGSAKIEFHGDGEKIITLFDRDKIKTVILNLIADGIRRGGEVSPFIKVSIDKTDDSATITVNTHSPGGSGDLPASVEVDVAAAYIRKHKGSLIMSTRPGGDSVYKVTVPLVQQGETAALSAVEIEWYGGMDIAGILLSGVLPADNYS